MNTVLAGILKQLVPHVCTLIDMEIESQQWTEGLNPCGLCSGTSHNGPSHYITDNRYGTEIEFAIDLASTSRTSEEQTTSQFKKMDGLFGPD